MSGKRGYYISPIIYINQKALIKTDSSSAGSYPGHKVELIIIYIIAWPASRILFYYKRAVFKCLYCPGAFVGNRFDIPYRWFDAQLAIIGGKYYGSIVETIHLLDIKVQIKEINRGRAFHIF